MIIKIFFIELAIGGTCGLYYKHIAIVNDNSVSDAPNCGFTYDRKLTAQAKSKAMAKNIYSTGITYDHHLGLSKYFYRTGHWWHLWLVLLTYCDHK